jgi:hypothetical protein
VGERPEIGSLVFELVRARKIDHRDRERRKIVKGRADNPVQIFQSDQKPMTRRYFLRRFAAIQSLLLAIRSAIV